MLRVNFALPVLHDRLCDAVFAALCSLGVVCRMPYLLLFMPCRLNLVKVFRPSFYVILVVIVVGSRCQEAASCVGSAVHCSLFFFFVGALSGIKRT